MNRYLQGALRGFTRVTRPLALRSAGTAGAKTALIRHVGRRSGRVFDTPVTAFGHDGEFLIALPYGERTDWLRNVLASGNATLLLDGQEIAVDTPRVIPATQVAGDLPATERFMLRLFRVDSALRLHRV